MVQNGTLVKLDTGAKTPYGGFFLLEFPIKKIMILVVNANIPNKEEQFGTYN
jgi:hypothetical protein